MKLPQVPELLLSRLSNGWIVKVIYSGESIMSEPYEKPVYVFETLLNASMFICDWMKNWEPEPVILRGLKAWEKETAPSKAKKAKKK